MKAHIKEAKKSSEQTKHVGGHDTESARSGAINLALTASGLKTLGKFSGEFREGMAPKPPAASIVPRRSSVLGDIREDSPEAWELGGWKEDNRQEMIDGVMLLYASNEMSLNNLIDEETSLMRDAAISGLTLFGRFEGNRSEGFRERFGPPLPSPVRFPRYIAAHLQLVDLPV